VPKSRRSARKYPAKEENTTLILFPNPTSGYLIVRTEQNSAIALIQIVDTQGKVVISQVFDNTSKTQIVSVAQLSPASYTVNMLGEDGAVIDKGNVIVNR
jgi:hypothetical protein